MTPTPASNPMTGTLTTRDGKAFHQRLEVGSGQMFYSLVPVDGNGPRVLVNGPDSLTVADLLRLVSEQLSKV